MSVCNSLEILWRGHDSELDSSLISESLVGPLADRAEHLDCCDTIIGNENLEDNQSVPFVARACSMQLIRKYVGRLFLNVSDRDSLDRDKLIEQASQPKPYLCDDGVAALCLDVVCYF